MTKKPKNPKVQPHLMDITTNNLVVYYQYELLIEDRSGATAFQTNHHRSNLRRVDTLTEAKEIIALVVECDRKEKTLRDTGWRRKENCVGVKTNGNDS